jgi:hypothetical protein
MLLLFLSRHSEATADRHSPPREGLYKNSHLKRERQKHGGQKHKIARRGAKHARLIDRSLENRQHGNKPHFTRVSLSFSTGNTAATGGNILLVFWGKYLTTESTKSTKTDRSWKTGEGQSDFNREIP